MTNSSLSFPILTAAEQSKFQSELLWELRRLILKYNGKSGSSIRTEAAEQILESMLYCVSACLRKEPDPARAVRATPGWEIYRRGLELVKGTVKESKMLYREVLATRIPTDLRVYNDTLNKGIPAFFQLYNPEFAAQQTIPLLDYPLLCSLHDLNGINYLKAYLIEMKKENVWCRKYRPNQIRAVLFLHARKCRLDYRELIDNIPQMMEPGLKEIQEKSSKNCINYADNF